MLPIPNENQTLLITGGAGFIGSNFIPFCLHKNPLTRIVNLDKLTYAGNPANLLGIEENERYHFVKGDICDKKLVNRLFTEFEIDGVIHFAAESHVDNSILNPDGFIKTNIEGTFTLLEAARRHWMNSPHQVKVGFEHARFHHISTDEVYGSLGEKGFFTERTAYAPNSPYSASKASSDFLVRSYYHTYGMNVVTSNCSNNFGPKQHDEKLIPTIIRSAINGEAIPIYGKGKNIRDWLYVNDHCVGINLIYHLGKSGETYLLGGDNEQNNLSVAYKICSLMNQMKPKQSGNYEDQIIFVEDRYGHDYRYAIDTSKIRDELGWQAEEHFDSALKKTILWYLKKHQK